MFTNKKTFNSYFTNKFNIVFNCEIHNTIDQKQELFKYSILKKLDNNRIDESIFIQNEDKTRMDQVKQCVNNRNPEGFPVYGYSGALNRHMKNDHNMTSQEIQEAKQKLKESFNF